MLHNSVATRYAQALYDMAKKGIGIDEQLAELLKVQLVLEENPPLRHALQSPTVPGQIKQTILRRLLENRVKAVTLHFLYVLVDKNREVYVTPILNAYKELMRKDRGEVEVTIQSAAPLAEGVLTKVQQTLATKTGKKVSLKAEVVPDLLGGMVIQIGDRVIDGSVRNQLYQMQERLSKTSAAAVGG